MERKTKKVLKMLLRVSKLDDPEAPGWTDMSDDERGKAVEAAETLIEAVDVFIDLALEKIYQRQDRRG